MHLRTLSILLWIAAESASAATVRVVHRSGDPGGYANVSLQGVTPAGGRTTWAGTFQWEDQDHAVLHRTFCVDLEHGVPKGVIEFDIVPLTEVRASSLVGGALTPHRIELLRLFWGQFRDAAGTPDTGCAFALGIWEIVYDGDLLPFDGNHVSTDVNFHAGLFNPSTQGGVSALRWAIARAWLLSVDRNGAKADLVGWTHPSVQLQIVEGLLPVPTLESSWGAIKSQYR